VVNSDDTRAFWSFYIMIDTGTDVLTSTSAKKGKNVASFVDGGKYGSTSVRMENGDVSSVRMANS
jgi:hypothetical protein